MRKFLVEIQFNGKNYSGFQSNGKGSSIEEKITYALYKLFGYEIEVTGCSRTDAGVSAESYFFDFSANTKLPTERVPFKLNRFLPKDIQAVWAKEVSPGFHARHDATRKTYEYSFYLSDHVLPLLNPKSHRLSPEIDLQKMSEACEVFVGKHDFVAFKAPEKEKRSTVRTVYDCSLIRDGKRVTLSITGDGFLYNMVRIIAGTIVAIGEGKMSLIELSKLLSCKKPRGDNPALTLPPNALILKSVSYEKSPY